MGEPTEEEFDEALKTAGNKQKKTRFSRLVSS